MRAPRIIDAEFTSVVDPATPSRSARHWAALALYCLVVAVWAGVAYDSSDPWTRAIAVLAVAAYGGVGQLWRRLRSPADPREVADFWRRYYTRR